MTNDLYTESTDLSTITLVRVDIDSTWIPTDPDNLMTEEKWQFVVKTNTIVTEKRGTFRSPDRQVSIFPDLVIVRVNRRGQIDRAVIHGDIVLTSGQRGVRRETMHWLSQNDDQMYSLRGVRSIIERHPKPWRE